jgi:hypothetical protein
VDPDTRIIDRTSGGLSLFATPNLTFSPDWWVVPVGTKVPDGFILTKDLTDGVFLGHYTVRSLYDIHEDIWRSKLLEWANNHVTHISTKQRAKRRV